MAEVLQRRYAGRADHPLPDLLMVDGGRGQLNVAVKILTEMNPGRLPATIAIAKKDPRRGIAEDRIFQPGRANPVSFGKERDLLLFLQQIRDEAHRTAVSFHRRSHRRSSLHSVLDEVPGIGPKRKQLLLSHYGSVEKVRAAPLEEMSGLPGMNRLAAQKVKEALS
jgi:excinuclease ABC subunit C